MDCLPQVWKVDEAGVVWESVHLSDHPITVQPSFTSGSHHLHFICCWFTHYLPSFCFACVKTLTRVDGGCISYQVYTPVPGAAVCDSWYAFRVSSPRTCFRVRKNTHGHQTLTVQTQSYNNMKKKKTDTRDPRSDLLISLCVAACKIEIIFNFFHDFPSIVPNTTHTHTHAQKDFLLSFLAHTENLNRNMHPHTHKHWSADTKPWKPHAAHPRLHRDTIYIFSQTP